MKEATGTAQSPESREWQLYREATGVSLISAHAKSIQSERN